MSYEDCTRDWVSYETQRFDTVPKNKGFMFMYEIELDPALYRWANGNDIADVSVVKQDEAIVRKILRDLLGRHGRDWWCSPVRSFEQPRIDLYTRDEQWAVQAKLMNTPEIQRILNCICLIIERQEW